MNTLLYVGLAFFAVGFIGFIISIIMERHYEIKLFELNQKLQKDEQWRKKTLQVEVSNATPMQVQTLKIELMLMARQWFRKVKVRIKG